jgi:hypothetical protein
MQLELALDLDSPAFEEPGFREEISGSEAMSVSSNEVISATSEVMYATALSRRGDKQ